MSDISIYDVSVGTFKQGVTVLINILKKGALQPDADTLPSARLIDDMLPLTFQVQFLCKTINRVLVRMVGLDIPMGEDKETTMEDLIATAEATLAILESIDPKTLEGKEATTIELPEPTGKITGRQFILGFALPNFFFHLQTAYAILRSKGVVLGKGDYLDPFKAGVL